MFCKFCGAPLDDGAAQCPNCLKMVEEETSKKSNGIKTEKLFKAPTKGGKSFAAVASALTLIPAIFILTLDYVWNYSVDWKATGYIVGALLVGWVCMVLPAVRVTPAPVTAGICFLAITFYVLFVVRQVTGDFAWFTVFALPAVFILSVFIGLNCALANSAGIKGLGMASLASVEAAVYSIIWGVLWDNYYHGGEIKLRASVIVASLFLMLAVVLGTATYITRVNKK